MTIEKTLINQKKLEYWCQQLPQCRTFLENFFHTCGPYDLETNRTNYGIDLDQCLRIDQSWKHYQSGLEKAFSEIVLDARDSN